jgi:hypothetical protein
VEAAGGTPVLLCWQPVREMTAAVGEPELWCGEPFSRIAPRIWEILVERPEVDFRSCENFPIPRFRSRRAFALTFCKCFRQLLRRHVHLLSFLISSEAIFAGSPK